MRIPLHAIRLGPNVCAGMNLMLVATLAYTLRTSLTDLEPITVRPDGTDRWQIVDGRHRLVAAMIAGRPDILATPETA